MQHLPDGKQIDTTQGDDVLCSPPDDGITAALSPCTHEEANTRMLLHTASAVRQCCQKIVLQTVDTELCPCSILTQDAILFHPLLQEAKSCHGRPGMHLMLMLQPPFASWVILMDR